MLFEEALRFFAEAEKIRPANKDDAILRWNRCVRILESLQPEAQREKEMEAFGLHDHDSPPPI